MSSGGYQLGAKAQFDRVESSRFSSSSEGWDPIRIFVAGESFGIKSGWGHFSGESAFGIAAAAVVTRDLFAPGRGRVAVGGGLGFGTSQGSVGGRVSGQLTW